MRIIDLDRIRSLVDYPDAIAAVRQALRAHADGPTTNPMPWHPELPEVAGEVHVKGAHLHGAAYFAIKVSTGFYHNRARGLPTSNGFVAVFDAGTGQPVLLLRDEGYLTELRTGAAGAIAADALARPDIESVAIVGTGGQARHQLAALLQVRRPKRLTICGRTGAHADALAAWARPRHDWAVTIAPDNHTAITSADLIITVTPATAPLIEADWLSPGVHITAVGADAPHKRELSPVGAAPRRLHRRRRPVPIPSARRAQGHRRPGPGRPASDRARQTHR